MHFFSKEKLLQKISHYAKLIVENRQISLRLEKLLPTRLKNIKTKHAQTTTRSKATRLALCDKEYEKFLLEYLEIKRKLTELVSSGKHIGCIFTLKKIRAKTIKIGQH